MLAVVAVVLIFLFVPQINHLVLRLPFPWEVYGDWNEFIYVLVVRVFFLMLLTAYIWMVIKVVPRSEALDCRNGENTKTATGDPVSAGTRATAFPCSGCPVTLPGVLDQAGRLLHSTAV